MAKSFDDLNGKSFPARLQELVVAWDKIAEAPLKKRKKLINLLASGYFNLNYGRWHTLNLIDRGVSTIVPFLVEGNPKIMVETKIRNYRPFAYTTQLALNLFLEKLRFAERILIPAAINSMFGAAITRTDFYYDRLISLNDEVIRAGSPMVELIDDSNYIGDPHALRRCDFTFEGDKYKLPTSYAKDFFGAKVADYIKPDCQLAYDISPSDISNPSFDRNKLSLKEYTTFMDIYLYDENKIVTLMPHGNKAKVLREREWDGPPGGPYDYLGYRFIPQSPIPIPPTWAWHDMDITVNILVNKMRELAENQKDIIAYSDEAEEDMKRVVKTPNLGTVRVSDVNAMKQLSLNGIKDSSNWDWVTFMLAEQTKQGANPDVLAGRGSQAPTLGQEQLIYNNATRIIGNMYSRFQDFMTQIVKKLAWAFWTDPTLYIPVIREIPGYGELPAVYTSDSNAKDFYDFAFEILPYSTQRMSPELRFQKTMQFALQWLIPTYGMAAQQGAVLDIPTLTKILSSYASLDNLSQYYATSIPDKLDMVPYQMQPTGKNRPNKEPMVNESSGTTLGNQNVNLNQQQKREGTGLETEKGMT